MSNDKQIEEYRKKVETKRTSLGQRPKAVYTTNQVLRFNSKDELRNLNLCTSLTACLYIVRDIMLQKAAHDDATRFLGLDLPLVFGDWTADEWLDDIKARAAILKWDAERTKLNAMDKKLAELLSDDAKTANAIADIAKDLGI